MTSWMFFWAGKSTVNDFQLDDFQSFPLPRLMARGYICHFECCVSHSSTAQPHFVYTHQGAFLWLLWHLGFYKNSSSWGSLAKHLAEGFFSWLKLSVSQAPSRKHLKIHWSGHDNWLPPQPHECGLQEQASVIMVHMTAILSTRSGNLPLSQVASKPISSWEAS